MKKVVNKMLNTKRAILLVFDILCIFAIIILLGAIVPKEAYAYVDPSVVTYAVQALAGIAVVAATVLGVAMRRTRRWLIKVLNIDENLKKEVDPPIYRTDSQGNIIYDNCTNTQSREVDSLQNQLISKKGNKNSSGTPAFSYKSRFGFSVAVVAFTLFTVFFVAPIEIISTAAQDTTAKLISFTTLDIIPLLTLSVVILTLIISILLSLVKGRIYLYLLSAFFSIGVGFYIQAMFLNSGLPIADGMEVDWSNYTQSTVLSAVIWLSVIVIPIVAHHFLGKKLINTICFVSIVLISIQAVGAGSLIYQDYNRYNDLSSQMQYVATTKDMYKVSKDKNVVVFVADALDQTVLDDALSLDPQLNSAFSGFLRYTDSTGSYMGTELALPYLLSGTRLQETDANMTEYIQDRYSKSNFLPEIKNAGYDISLFSDATYIDMELSINKNDHVKQIADSTLNFIPLSPDVQIEPSSALTKLYQIALYRDLPWVFKPNFYFYTAELDSDVIRETEHESYSKFTLDDIAYYDGLKNVGLDFLDTESKGLFSLVHLIGPHSPYYYDENVKYVGNENSDVNKQTRGSLNIILEYIQQMKDLGVYENSTIIVMADHGKWMYVEKDGNILESQNPALMVKPATKESQDMEPGATSSLETSTLPTGHFNFNATILDALGIDSQEYGPTFSKVNPDLEERYYYALARNEAWETIIKEYKITGDSNDFNNWELTGKYWDYRR